MKQLTEEDLEKIFISSKLKQRSPLVVFFKFFGLFVMFFLILFIGLNFSAYWQKISFWYNNDIMSESSDSLSQIISKENIKINEEGNQIPNISDNSLYIENINVKAPITFRVATDENEILSALKNGLVQIQGTALPGENGNIFITGHSSNYPWVRSDYNSIFALLNKLVIGDAVLIKFHNQNYIYKVSSVSVVSPSDVGVMEPKPNQSTLTLMTCSPVGTNLKRLIVVANQIYPDSSMNYTSGTPLENKNLPEGVR